jgi:ABC-2 type transport system ATP-binding protein
MLTLTNLCKRFGTITAVDGVSLRINPGEVFGLLGPNGAGKSTTINMAVGLLEPDSGSVELEGFGRPRDPAVRSRIGVAPQSLAIYDDLTGRENVKFFASLYPGGIGAARIDEVLEMVGLSDRASTRAKTYSGGMKRRLNLACSLVHDPDVLLLDEPTVGVDPQSRNAIFELVQSLKARGRTVLYTTHYMEEAQRLCDRVGIIDRGKLLAVDSVAALIQAHGGQSTVRIERRGVADTFTLTDDPLSTIQSVLKAGGADGVAIESPNLRD